MSERNNPCEQDDTCVYLGDEFDELGNLLNVYRCGTEVKKYLANPPPPEG